MSAADEDLQSENPLSHANARIKEVWDGNVEEELAKISELLDTYKYVGMDTEFPGFCINANPDPTQKDSAYKFIKSNVDVLKVIQIGITLSDKDGNLPPGICTWQFNLKFDVNKDRSSESSIELLRNAGISFNNLQEFGIDPIRMADLLTCSGLAFDEEIKWITFHGAFDFAYLLKLLTNQNLPATLDTFNSALKLHFATTIDLKVIVNDVHEKRNCSLSKLGKDLDLIRTGVQHQAGSDSFLTVACYHKLVSQYFCGDEAETKRFVNKIYGLTPDTMYTSNTVTSTTMMNNNTMDMSNNFYYGQVIYPNFYAGLGFPETQAYYGTYDQQQMFNAYNYSPMQGRLDFANLNNSQHR